MATSSVLRVSVDMGCHRDSIAIGLPGGRLLEEFEIDQHPDGFEAFFERIDKHRKRYGGAVGIRNEGIGAVNIDLVIVGQAVTITVRRPRHTGAERVQILPKR